MVLLDVIIQNADRVIASALVTNLSPSATSKGQHLVVF
jgi:hypothetical protein